jgi:hypothetical protein
LKATISRLHVDPPFLHFRQIVEQQAAYDNYGEASLAFPVVVLVFA